MHRLRTVTYLDVSAVAEHHAMPAALLLGVGMEKVDKVHFSVALVLLDTIMHQISTPMKF